MKEFITLQDLLDAGNTATGLKGDGNEFLSRVITTLGEDPIRTASIKQKIQSRRLEFELHKDWPLNDFYEALERYFQSLGFSGRLPQMDEFQKSVFQIVNP